MAVSTPSTGASARTHNFPDHIPLEDASNILASIAGTLHVLIGHLEEREEHIGLAPIQAAYLTTYGLDLAKQKLDATVSAMLAAKNAREGC